MNNEELQTARRLLRNGQEQAAWDSYERCLSLGLPVHEEYAGALYMRGRYGDTVAVLDRAISLGGDAENLLFLRSLAFLTLGLLPRALADLDAAITLNPLNLHALRKRATLLAQLDRLEGALEDFAAIMHLAPDDHDAAANYGIILLRKHDYSAAVEQLLQSHSRTPGNLRVTRSLANALRGAGRTDEALRLFEKLRPQAPEDNALLTDHALALLSAGQAEAALPFYLQASRQDPGDQWALTGKYLALGVTGEMGQARQLMDYDNLLVPADTDSRLLTAQFINTIQHHADLRWEPIGKSTLGGQQTSLLDLSPGGPFHETGEFIAANVRRTIAALRENPAMRDHPWMAGMPREWRLQAWATVLHGNGGHQRPHTHPAGWLSGVFYVDTGSGGAGQGELVFGHPPDELKLPNVFPEYRHVPASGQLLLFPSFFLHHTTPYFGQTPRISIAFDVVRA